MYFALARPVVNALEDHGGIAVVVVMVFQINAHALVVATGPGR